MTTARSILLSGPDRTHVINQVMNAPSNGGCVGTVFDGEWALTVDTIKHEVRGYAVRYRMSGDEVVGEVKQIDIAVSIDQVRIAAAVARAVDQIVGLWA